MPHNHKRKSGILGSGWVRNAMLAAIALQNRKPTSPPAVHVHNVVQLGSDREEYVITPRDGDKLILVRKGYRMKVCLGTLKALEDITEAVAHNHDLAIDANLTIWAVGELGLIKAVLEKLPITEVILYDI